MSLQVYTSKGSSILDLVSNIKISIAVTHFQPKLTLAANETEAHLSLKDTKTGFELTEPNAIVKYLANDFSESEAIKYEETILYGTTKASASPSTEDVSSLAIKKLSLTEAKITAEQIITFAGLYPNPPTHNEWFEQFSKIPEVHNAVETAIKLTSKLQKPDRKKEVNTGAQNVVTGHLVKPQAKKILPKENERNILITSALPYVNNVPHLGNIVGSVLSADIYARYAKNRNYNALFICGTDEYGTATETKAIEEKVTPLELCTKYYKIHKEIYEWFEIGFDYFGRTTTPDQTAIAQDIFLKLNENGYLEEQTNAQLYCEVHNSFLADRFVEGTCPKCAYEDARGDQCDKCGNLLNPFELINPRCKLDNSVPVSRDSTNVYLKLEELEPELKKWVAEASEKGGWTKNSKTITNSWLKEGLNSRCITRDLKWGTPVPLEKFSDKVLYVWFDAPIGYVSITSCYFEEEGNKEWEKWWKNPENVDLYQFMGKDNVPFHCVVFPSTQIGTRENWTKLHHINTTEYLQYEGGKFSKSRGVGVFGNNAKETGVSASVWRYYLASIRPESSDSQFSWQEFVTKNNSELLANLGNFVNRLAKFVDVKYNGVIPSYKPENIPSYASFESDINKLLASYIEAMEASSIRRGLELAMAISSRGNQFLQDNKLDNTLYSDHPDKSDAVVSVGLNLVYLLSSIFSPFMPEVGVKIDQILNAPALSITNKFELVLKAGHCIGKPQYLFTRIDEKKVEEWRGMYGGQQKK
ncbi:methionine--tRNA ligase, cytoplasmic [[Candida] railenensis]|uniref:methionine--tRNA ligase n=1 Tax=[Candida] railenensis TaxID=45579 RepID=A0A9P0QS10_9ASCO|nr:methionine--tRNA ligase, cytoplasmic [[Candida] railenensis]